MRLVFVLIVYGFISSCSYEGGDRQFVDLSEESTLPENQWLEFSSTIPLKMSAFMHELCFIPVEPIKLAEDPMGLVDGAGAYIDIKAIIINTNNEEVTLPLQSYSDTSICYGISTNIPNSKEYRSIKIWSPKEIRIKEVRWRSTDK